MLKLRDLEKGDKIRLTKNGLIWTVFHRTNGAILNPVIQLKSKNGSFRTYTPCNKRWNKKVWK